MAHQRIKFEGEVSVRTGEREALGRGRNLSQGGILLDLAETYPVGSEAELRIPLDDGETATFRATVVRTTRTESPRHLVAFYFFRETSDHHERLARFLAKRLADPRVSRYLEAALGMLRGDFRFDIDSEAGDEIGRLGGTLVRVGRAMESELTRLRKLVELASRITAGLRMEEVLDHIFESFQTLLPFTRLGLALIEDNGQTVRAAWSRSQNIEKDLLKGYRARLEGSSLADMIASRRPRILNDLEAYLREHPKSESTRRVVEEGYRASLTCPLISYEEPLGFLFFSSSQKGVYEPAHVESLNLLAGHVSMVLEKARLFDELVQSRRSLEKANQRLTRLATIDGLTGVENRRSFELRYSREWRKAARDSTSLALAMVDIDFFKPFNDSQGHIAGDAALREVAQCMETSLQRPGDQVFRFGGEEFAAILPNCDLEGATFVAERLRSAVEALQQPHARSSVSSWVTISVGVAVCKPVGDLTPEVLIRAADEALYQAKEGGRNRVAGLAVPARPSPEATAARAEPPTHHGKKLLRYNS